MWTEQEAQEKFAELLQRAEAGEPQVIDGEPPCVVITKAEYERLKGRNAPHLGKWLVANAPRIGDIELPPRAISSGSEFG